MHHTSKEKGKPVLSELSVALLLEFDKSKILTIYRDVKLDLQTVSQALNEWKGQSWPTVDSTTTKTSKKNEECTAKKTAQRQLWGKFHLLFQWSKGGSKDLLSHDEENQMIHAIFQSHYDNYLHTHILSGVYTRFTPMWAPFGVWKQLEVRRNNESERDLLSDSFKISNHRDFFKIMLLFTNYIISEE